MSVRDDIPPLATTGGLRARAHLAQQVDVGPGQHAVGGDVGDHVAGAAGRVQPVEGLVQVTALPGPAAGGEPAAADVEADGDLVAVASAITSAHHSGRSSAAVPMLTRVHPVARARSRLSSSRMPPDSSTCNRIVRGDLGDDLGVVAAAERGVQVDQVDPLGTGVLPALRGGPRVTEHLLRAGHALHELDRLAAGHIDRRQQLQPVTPPRVHAETLSSCARAILRAPAQQAVLASPCCCRADRVTVPRKREELAPAPGVNQRRVDVADQQLGGGVGEHHRQGVHDRGGEADHQPARPRRPGRPPPAAAPASRSADPGPGDPVELAAASLRWAK